MFPTPLSRGLFTAIALAWMTGAAFAQTANRSGPSAQQQYNAELSRQAQESNLRGQEESRAAIERMKAEAAARRQANEERAESLRREYQRGQEAIAKATRYAPASTDDNGVAGSVLHPQTRWNPPASTDDNGVAVGGPHPIPPQTRTRQDDADRGRNSRPAAGMDPATRMDASANDPAADAAQMDRSRMDWEKLRRELGSEVRAFEISPADLDKEAAEIRAESAAFDEYGQRMKRANPSLGDDPAQLYIDEYPLPADSRYETASDWWRARVKNGDSPNQLYLVEPRSTQQYDEDGFPLKSGNPLQPNVLPQTPRYEKLSPAERRRLWWLPDSPDQRYLVE